jgi:hypothetical protein
LRFGVNNTEVAFGTGLNLGIMEADFAYVMKELGGNLGFSFNLNFGQNMDEMTKDQIEKSLEDAKELLNSDYFFMAKRQFEYILSFDPNRKEIKDIIERIDKALPFVESSYDDEKKTWEQFRDAKRMFNENKYAEAQRLFEEVKKVNPNNRFVTYYLDEIQLKR